MLNDKQPEFTVDFGPTLRNTETERVEDSSGFRKNSTHVNDVDVVSHVLFTLNVVYPKRDV